MSSGSFLAIWTAGMAVVLGAVWVASIVSPFISDFRKANWEYDQLINTLIDGDMFELETVHTIRSRNLRVWVSNYPHSFGHPYGCGVSDTLSISRPTKWKLKRYIERKSVLAALQKVKQKGATA